MVDLGLAAKVRLLLTDWPSSCKLIVVTVVIPTLDSSRRWDASKFECRSQWGRIY
jgi:hypothetical protein